VGRSTSAEPDPTTQARRRLIAGLAGLVAEEGLRAMTVGGICAAARMSRRTFYDVFDDLDDCLVTGIALAFDELQAAVAAVAEPVCDEPWEARAVRIVTALVAAFEGNGSLSHLCLIDEGSGGPAGHAIRRDALTRLAAALADQAPLEDAALRHATARGAVVAVLELADARGGESDAVVPSAVYVALAPFSGRSVAGHWSRCVASVIAAAPPRPPAEPAPWWRYAPNVTELSRRTLLHLEASPGASNVAVARAIGVAHDSQISRHLARLEREGVVERRREGRANVWRLTARGQELARRVR
jgi:AcrR family transcriptional regulator